MKTWIVGRGRDLLSLVRSLPRRNENKAHPRRIFFLLYMSEAYLEGMKTALQGALMPHRPYWSEAYLEGMKTGVPDAWRVRSILTSEAYLEGMKTGHGSAERLRFLSPKPTSKE